MHIDNLTIFLETSRTGVLRAIVDRGATLHASESEIGEVNYIIVLRCYAANHLIGCFFCIQSYDHGGSETSGPMCFTFDDVGGVFLLPKYRFF